jgi:outer membrane biosynthesis protein TonB
MKVLLAFVLLYSLGASCHTKVSATNRQPSDTVVDTCKTGKDTLTGRMIYLSAEIAPEVAGGLPALIRRLNKNLQFPAIPLSNEIESNYVVAFIVETDSSISGERVIHGSDEIGQQILKVAKNLKWSPGKCNGKNVPILHRLPMIIEFRSEP